MVNIHKHRIKKKPWMYMKRYQKKSCDILYVFVSCLFFISTYCPWGCTLFCIILLFKPNQKRKVCVGCVVLKCRHMCTDLPRAVGFCIGDCFHNFHTEYFSLIKINVENFEDYGIHFNFWSFIMNIYVIFYIFVYCDYVFGCQTHKHTKQIRQSQST